MKLNNDENINKEKNIYNKVGNILSRQCRRNAIILLGSTKDDTKEA